jgi:guanine deaminase
MTDRLIMGQMLAFDGDPFAEGHGAVRHDRRAALLIRDGRIAAVGAADGLRARHPDAAVTDHGDALILPGFVDAHAHYPQTAIIASWGKRLIDWLNS